VTSEELRLSAIQIASQPHMMMWDGDPSLMVARAGQIYDFLRTGEAAKVSGASQKQRMAVHRRVVGQKAAASKRK
jgi:hypothetical protein